MLIRLFVLLLSLPLHATVFQKQSVDQQIKESDGIVMGHYLRSKAIRLDDGKIATQMIFKMDKETGMQSELFGMDEVIVHYPGGKIGDEHVKVEGVPTFVPGENIVLMIKSHQDRFWGMNLGFGSFKIINYGKERLIVNTLFPEDLAVSQVKLEDFERSVKNIKGSGLKVVFHSSYPSETGSDELGRMPASVEEGKKRSIASKTDQEENDQGSSAFNSFWLVFVLALMGGIFRLTRQKEAP